MNWPTEEPTKLKLNAREAVRAYGDSWRLMSRYSAADLITAEVRDYCRMRVCHLHVRGRHDIAMKQNLLAWW